MIQVDYVVDFYMWLIEVKKYYDGVVYMKKFLEFIGVLENSFNIIKESKVWLLFFEMGKLFLKNFGDDLELQVCKNEIMNLYFGVIFYQIYVGVSGNIVRIYICEYGKNVVNSVDNEDFNDDVVDIVDDLFELLQDDEIYIIFDLM